MAVFDEATRAEHVAEIMRGIDCPGAVLKAQLRAVYDALDDWWEASGATAANTAIPQPQRGLLTARQKSAIFQLLLTKKYGAS